MEYDKCSVKNCSSYNDGKCITNTKNGCGKVEAYKQGIADERERIVDILENHWLHGFVARRIIDEIIEKVRGEQNE